MNEEEKTTITDDPAAVSADKNTSHEEKRFTQKELDQLVSERLTRERKNNACLEQLRTAIDKLRTDGVIKSSSYSDVVAEILSRCPSENETEETETNPRPVTNAALSQDQPVSDELSNTTDASAPAAESPNGEEPVTNPLHSMTLDELYALSARFPHEAVASDVLSDGFRAFIDGRSGTPADVYGAFLRVKHALTPHAADSESEKDDLPVVPAPQVYRGSSAFGTDAYGDNLPNLTRQQMELARENGMSLREYAALLGSIPTRVRM